MNEGGTIFEVAPLAKKEDDALLSVLGALSSRMDALRLGMNPVGLRAQPEPGIEVFLFHRDFTR